MQKYLPNLDGVRAIAALMVMLAHIEIIKTEYNLQPIYSPNLSVAFAALGLTLFFVLSGFLITYLLLGEKQKTNTVGLKNFYIRRTLRIWPLYFTVILLGYFILPQTLSVFHYQFSTISLILSCLFLTNIDRIYDRAPAFIDPIWSIGVEEQFYLFWPFIVKKNSIIRGFKFCIAIIFIFYFLKIYFMINATPNNEPIRSFLYGSRFDNMMTGALGAFFVRCVQFKIGHFDRVVNFLFNKKIQLLNYLFTIIFLILSVQRGTVLIHQIFAINFMIMIINLSNNPKNILNLEYKFLKFLGKISFGIYLLHMPFVHLILWLVASKLSIKNIVVQNIFIYVLIILLSILTATISYYYLEERFLKLKSKFEVK